MRRARTTIAIIAMLSLMSVMIAACGGDDDDGGDAATPAATPEATETAAATSPAAAPSDGSAVELRLGAVMPETGSLANLGVPMIEAIRLAVEDVNSQGGNIRFTLADSGTSPSTALEAVRRLLGEGAQAIVGAAASAVSQGFIQTLFDEQTPQCSPSNSSPVFTDQENADYYFRTSVPDTAIAPIIADVVIATGAYRVAIIGRADSWGNALDELVTANLEDQGAEVFSALYDPETPTYTSEVDRVVAFGPDMVINLGFESDGTATVRQLLESGIGPERQMAAHGLYTPNLWELVDSSNPSVLDGMLGISQNATKGDESFKERLQARAGDYIAYGAEGYDCVILLALAARVTGNPDDGDAMIASVQSLTHDGVECHSYGECAALIDAGMDIDYVGQSGPLNYTAAGDPTVASYAVFTWENGGEVVRLSVETVDLAAR